MNQNEQMTRERLNEICKRFHSTNLVSTESIVQLMNLAYEGLQLREVEQLNVKRFIEIQLAEIEPKWTAEGKGGYWWGVKIGMETVLNKIAELEKTDL